MNNKVYLVVYNVDLGYHVYFATTNKSLAEQKLLEQEEKETETWIQCTVETGWGGSALAFPYGHPFTREEVENLITEINSNPKEWREKGVVLTTCWELIVITLDEWNCH